MTNLTALREIAEVAHREVVNDPTKFAAKMLGLHWWSRQQDVANSVVSHSQTAVKSGHKNGKTNCGACLALWWMLTRPRGRVILTAPTGHQVKDCLWKELWKIYREAPVKLTPTPPNLDPHTGWRLGDGREIIAITTDKPENVAGPSGPDQLVIVDEASGYSEDLWPALMSMIAGGGKILAIGNPTRTAGTFYEAFHSKRELWNTLSISSLESPNVVQGKIVIPGLATREWIEARRTEYGEDSPLWAVRVLGEFPGQGENAVIPLAYVETALERWQDGVEPSGAWTIGLDVARFGDDDSVAQPRRGFWAPLPRVAHGYDTIQVSAMVRDMLVGPEAIRKPHEPVTVNVDMGGNFGGGVLDTLLVWNRDHLLGDHVTICGVNPSNTANDPERFPAMREQLWWDMRDWLKGGGAIAPNPKLEGELVAPVYMPDSKGRPKLERKEETKKRLTPRRSPDRADALALAVHDEGPLNLMAFEKRERSGPALSDLWGINLTSAGAGSRWDGVGGKGY